MLCTRVCFVDCLWLESTHFCCFTGVSVFQVLSTAPIYTCTSYFQDLKTLASELKSQHVNVGDPDVFFINEVPFPVN